MDRNNICVVKTDRSTVLSRLQLWEHRMGTELPVAIVATLAALTGLEEIRLNRDKQGTMFCASGALVQAVGVITERYREANLPIHILAAEIGIPDWVTNLRHQIAHGPCQVGKKANDSLLIDLVLDRNARRCS